MIFDHYLQLFLYYRKLIVWFVAGMTGTVAGLSTLFLFLLPYYTSAASVVLLPTEAELAYMRGFTSVGVEGASPAEMLPATYIEYLISKPVAEKVYDKVLAELETAPPPEGWRLTMQEAISEAMNFVWMVYNTLNSGKFVEPSPRDRAVTKLIKGIDLETVENSYVLQIEVTLPRSAEATTIAANALADAYVERVREQSATASKAIIAYLQNEISTRLDERKKLQDQEFKLRQDAGILAWEQERNGLLATREQERERLLEIQSERDELKARLKAYEEDRAALQRQGTLAMVEQEISLSDAQFRALEQREQIRLQSIARVNEDLAKLNERENPLLEIEQEIERLDAEISDLRDRQITQSLSRMAGMAQLRIVNPAVVPDYPSFPEVVIYTIIAFVGSIFVVIFGLVAADTLSGSVKTTVDLRRLAGGNGLGLIPNGILRHLKRGKGVGGERKLKKLLRQTGAELEPRMVAKGMFDGTAVLVTGVGKPEFVSQASLALACTLAGQGASVGWRATSECPPVDVTVAERLGVKAFDSRPCQGSTPASDDDDREGVRIECIGPMSTGFNWSKVTDRSAGIVCVFQDGVLTEEDLLEIRENAVRRGVPEMTFILVPS